MKFRVALLFAGLMAAASGFGASAAELNFAPAKGNGIYAVGEKVGWTVTAVPGASAHPVYTYTVRSNGAVEIGKGTLDLTKGSGEISATLDHPGMIYVTIDRAPLPGPAPDEAAKINATLKAVVVKKDKALKPIFAFICRRFRPTSRSWEQPLHRPRSKPARRVRPISTPSGPPSWRSSPRCR